jgi:hypothetical protein
VSREDYEYLYEDERARELIRQEIEEGIETLTDDDLVFRASYYLRPLTDTEIDVMRRRLE